MNKCKENCCCEEQEKFEPEEMECMPHHKPRKKTETILNCGTVTGSAPLSCNPGMVLDGGGSYGFQPKVQASVVLDTDKLEDVTVKIDFSSLISFKTCDDDFFLHLEFKLIKICGGATIPLGTWTFEESQSKNYGGGVMQESTPPKPSKESIQETESFCFSWCECDDCPGCCRYIVELVDQQCYNIVFVAISNISLTALAVGEKESY